MALIEDKIDEIRDQELREVILSEVKKLKREKNFGLVFEEHIPELAPIYSAPIRSRAVVALKNGSLSDTYSVIEVNGNRATVIKDSGDTRETVHAEELVVVKRFGEPIYPALVPVARVERGGNAPFHVIIEADNFHALQLLEYTYAGRVDAIYIDPPYNTGARDWKYNNNYVDANDSFRHSKWLAMMKKRLLLAIKLLKDDGVICITIDDLEGHHLKCLLESSLKSLKILGTVAIKTSPSGRPTLRGFRTNHEYAIFLSKSASSKIGGIPRSEAQLSLFTEQDKDGYFAWVNFRKRGGANTLREARPRQYYPIYVQGESLRIPQLEWNRVERRWEILEPHHGDETVVLPLGDDGKERIWSLGYETAKDKVSTLKVDFSDRYGLRILRKSRLESEESQPSTWWDDPRYSIVDHGTVLLEEILGRHGAFPFPKSIYATLDCLRVACAGKTDALILDFFAGSGTTLHATALLNEEDGGNRQCIIVTNNEVSEDEANTLAAEGYQSGDLEWEAQGVCRSVTFPRCKHAINGHRDDGTPLEGEYSTGRTSIIAKRRTFRRLGFIDPDALTTAARKQEIVSLIDTIPMAAIKPETAYFVGSDKRYTHSILFDDTKAEEWLGALDGIDHVTHFFIVTRSNKHFNDLKARVIDLLGQVKVKEEVKSPISKGFAANLAYFRLDFLDPTEIALGEQFTAILPVLWLQAGAKGRLGVSERNMPYFIADDSPFAVLIDETRFREFQQAIGGRDDLTYVYLITDSEDAFFEMKEELGVSYSIMLYEEYLENFKINAHRV